MLHRVKKRNSTAYWAVTLCTFKPITTDYSVVHIHLWFCFVLCDFSANILVTTMCDYIWYDVLFRPALLKTSCKP